MSTESTEPTEKTGEEDTRIVKLKSRDGATFEIPASAASLSQLVKTTIDDCDEEDDDEMIEVEIPKVGSSCLAKVVEYCVHYEKEKMVDIKAPLPGDTLEENVPQPWYRSFSEMEQAMTFEIVTAANFMEIQPLLDLACLRVSMNLMGKSADEIRAMLNIPKMTPEEEAKAREEHSWIFE